MIDGGRDDLLLAADRIQAPLPELVWVSLQRPSATLLAAMDPPPTRVSPGTLNWRLAHEGRAGGLTTISGLM